MTLGRATGTAGILPLYATCASRDCSSVGVRTDSDSSVGDVECDSVEAARSKYEDTLVVEDEVVDVITEREEEDVDCVRSRVVDEALRECEEELVLALLALRITLRCERRRVLDWLDEVEGVARS